MNRKRSLFPSTELLWPLILWAGLIIFVSLVPLVPNDFWWHLKIGEQIFKSQQIPTTNQFSWIIPTDQPFHYAAWLGELLLYMLYYLGQLELVIFTRNLLAAAFFGFIILETHRRTGSWRMGAVALALAGGMILNNLIVRPQIWSWLPFVVFILILGYYAQQRIPTWSLLALPLIMVFWVNVHGAFILGGVILGIYFIGEALRTNSHHENSLPWRKIFWIGGTGILTGAAMFANPQGIGIVKYVLDLMTDKTSQKLVVEWQSPTPAEPANLIFFTSVILLLIVLAYTRYKPTVTEILLIVFFLWLAFSGQRYVIWFGVIATPVLAQASLQLPVHFGHLTSQKNWANAVLAGLILIPVILVQPWWVGNIPLPEKFAGQYHTDNLIHPLIDAKTPLAAVEYLRQHPGGNIFNDMGYGSYLIWALPDQRVFTDPRVELYSYEQWQDYIRITNAIRYNQILEDYGANRILLDREQQGELALALLDDPKWSLEYQDALSQIWIRK